MTEEAPPPVVRHARARDLPLLASIEGEADRMFVERFAATDWDPPTPGQDRVAEPGFVLVAGDPPVGFAHVLEVEVGWLAHLQLLAVRPGHQRRGTGTALVRAALAEAGARGHDRLTLSTYRDVPWNAPFYERLGFTELTDLDPWLREVVAAERRTGIEQHGDRLVMVAPTTRGGRGVRP